jgi:hypothetical protein
LREEPAESKVRLDAAPVDRIELDAEGAVARIVRGGEPALSSLL